MSTHRVDVFFYGSYINFEVLEEVDIMPRPYEVCRVNGFRLTISPLANLVPDPQGSTYGILTKLSHPELECLYNEHARGKLGGIYLPEAVLVYQSNGIYTPALTYISHDMPPAKTDPAYVARIYGPAEKYGFPKWYLAHIASFR